MRAYQFSYKHLDTDNDEEYQIWKVAKDEKTAFKFAFGKSQNKNQDKLATKRGSYIQITNIKDYEVSKILPITPVLNKVIAEEVSNNGDWLL